MYMYNNSPLPGAARSKYFLKKSTKNPIRQHAWFLKILFVILSIRRNGFKFFLGKQSLSNSMSKVSLSSKYLFTSSDLNRTWFKIKRKKEESRFNTEDDTRLVFSLIEFAF